ncbi:hypothetical protein GCM10010967_47800 [Dyadobacter beijingensis]|uniref:Uncharacterized protein n=1 Tax=Dyadobacter beijingensis TaxID=365489 RepID=A0ABQ2IDR5_9BACT|nr:hypothetical protein GCM10010967_47800 [Dyadobacter beijingensis]
MLNKLGERIIATFLNGGITRCSKNQINLTIGIILPPLKRKQYDLSFTNSNEISQTKIKAHY